MLRTRCCGYCGCRSEHCAVHGSNDLGGIMRGRCRADFVGKTICTSKHARTANDGHRAVAVHLPETIDELANPRCIARRRSKDDNSIWLALCNLLHDFVVGDTTCREQHFIASCLQQVGAELTCRVLRLFRSAYTEQPTTVALGLAVAGLRLIHQHAQDPRCVSVGECRQLILPPHSKDHLHRWPVQPLCDLVRGETGRFKLAVQFAHTSAVAADTELKKPFQGEVDVESVTHGAGEIVCTPHTQRAHRKCRGLRRYPRLVIVLISRPARCAYDATVVRVPPTSESAAAPASPAGKPAWDGQTLQGDPHRRDDKAQRVQAMFTAIAHAYDLNNRLHSLGLDQSWRRRTVRLVEPVVGSRVLDVACGTGDLAEAFARAGAMEVTGLDYTAAMLDHARVKAAKAGGTVARIRYLQGDAQSLPFASGSFDIVSIAFGIRNVADPAKALAEFHRVLAPGGRVAILEFSRPKAGFVRFVSDLYTQRIMPWTASLIARDGSGAYHYLPKSVETFLDPSALSAQLCSAGFAHVTAHPMTMNTCTALIGRVAS